MLTERRINMLNKKPLVAAEFIAPLARIDPVYTEEEEALKVSIVLYYWIYIYYCIQSSNDTHSRNLLLYSKDANCVNK